MSLFNKRLFLASVWMTAASSSMLIAEDTVQLKPKEAIRRVLASESQRAVDRREELKALRADAHAEPAAYWQSGFIKTQGQWLPAEDLSQNPVTESLADYRSKRDKLGTPSAKTHLALAKWCREKKLVDQERAHLYAALAGNTQLQTKANLSRLGFVHSDQSWHSPEELAELKRYSFAIEGSLQKWGTKVERIKAGIANGGLQKTSALKDLNELTDASVVAALDLKLAAHGGAYLRAAISQLGKIPSFESTQTLAKYAITESDEQIRGEAINAVKERRYDDYMPPLIGMLATEKEFQIQLSRPGGLYSPWILGFRWGRETESRIEKGLTGVYMQTRVVPVRTGPGPFRIEGVNYIGARDAATKRRAEAELYERVTALEKSNDVTRELNQRAANLLAAVTGQPAETDPRRWWEWWYQENNWTRPADRPVVEVSENLERVGEVVALMYARMSCFRKGTLVWSEQGRVPIEDLRVGDLVVAQDPETGELALKPVVRTSINPKQQTMRVRYGDEEIVATRGHQCWQAGDGWKRCKQFQAGEFLHTIQGSQQVASIVPEVGVEDVYNLVVADFHTYFVGESGVLAQDLFSPRPTNNIAPGLSKFELNDAKPSVASK